MERRERRNAVTVLAPAKLNLALDVVGLLPNGYHALDMTMQTITLYERVVLRRSAGRAELRIEHAGVSLDPSSQQVSYQGKPVPMTPKEYLLLHELLSQPGKVLTRERLAQLLYGWDEEAESNTLEVHIHHLRKKLFSSLIRTVRGVGYLVEEQS